MAITRSQTKRFGGDNGGQGLLGWACSCCVTKLNFFFLAVFAALAIYGVYFIEDAGFVANQPDWTSK